jgi:hypothetical protein
VETVLDRGAGAIFERLQIRPSQQSGEEFWHARASQLIMAPAHFETQHLPASYVERTVQLIRRPTRVTVAKAVADVHRYPKFLAHGAPSQVAGYVGAWHKQRLTAMSGLFRNAEARRPYRVAIGDVRRSDPRGGVGRAPFKRPPYRRLVEAMERTRNPGEPGPTDVEILRTLMEHIDTLSSSVSNGPLGYDFDQSCDRLAARIRKRVLQPADQRVNSVDALDKQLNGLRPDCLRRYHVKYELSVEDLLAICSGFLARLEHDSSLTFPRFLSELFNPDELQTDAMS